MGNGASVNMPKPRLNDVDSSAIHLGKSRNNEVSTAHIVSSMNDGITVLSHHLPPICEQLPDKRDKLNRRIIETEDENALSKYDQLINSQMGMMGTVSFLKQQIKYLLDQVKSLQLIALENNLQYKIITKVTLNAETFPINIQLLETQIKTSIEELKRLKEKEENMHHQKEDQNEKKKEKLCCHQWISSEKLSRGYECFLINSQFNEMKKTSRQQQSELSLFMVNFDEIIELMGQLSQLCKHRRYWGTRLFSSIATTAEASPIEATKHNVGSVGGGEEGVDTTTRSLLHTTTSMMMHKKLPTSWRDQLAIKTTRRRKVKYSYHKRKSW